MATNFNFTTLEKHAVASVLLDIANADGKVTNEEAGFLRNLQNFENITDEDIRSAHSMSVALSLAILKNMDQEKKQGFVALMALLINIDNDINQNETNIFAAVVAFIDVEIPS